MSNKKTYRAKSKSGELKNARNKKLSIVLVVSMAVLLSVYFGMIKARLQIIQEIYIWGAFILAVIYVVSSAYLALLKEKRKDNNTQHNAAQGRIPKLENACRFVLLLMIPMIFALLIDYMLILFGAAGYFGI